MRRGMYVVALSFALYAMTLIFGYFSICRVIDVRGEWATQDHVAHPLTKCRSNAAEAHTAGSERFLR
jgi:hypothetical protein